MVLEAKLAKIQGILTPEHFPSEAAVSQGIVLPILRELNWDTDNPMVVRPEYTAGRGRVDFALCEQGSPKVFIEVKGLGGGTEDAVEQVMQYAFRAGVRIVVLTDGRTWSFYLPGKEGLEYEEKRVSKPLDISEHSLLREASEVLQRYLERSRVVSGEALKTANVIFLLEKLRKDAPDKWKWMVAEAIAQFKRTFNNFKYEIKSESAQDNNDVVDYFHSLLREEISQIPTVTTAPRPQPELGRQEGSPSPSPTNNSSKGEKRKGRRKQGSRSGKLVILRQPYSYSNQSEAMAIVFRQLQEENPEFLQLFYEHRENKSYGGRRRYLGRNQQELFGNNVKNYRSHQRIGRDWIISTNYSWPGKKEIVQLAAEVAGLEFGRDIIINFDD